MTMRRDDLPWRAVNSRAAMVSTSFCASEAPVPLFVLSIFLMLDLISSMSSRTSLYGSGPGGTRPRRVIGVAWSDMLSSALLCCCRKCGCAAQPLAPPTRATSRVVVIGTRLRIL